MTGQIDLQDVARADDRRRDAARNDGTAEMLPDLAYKRLATVHVVSTAGQGRATAIGCLSTPGFRARGT